MENITTAINYLSKHSSSLHQYPVDRILLDHASLRQILTYVVLPVLAAYPVLTSLLRFRRVRKLQQQYSQYSTRESFSRMTDRDAWEIQKVIAQLEFPFMYVKALQFALFRTYGIPTISHTLTKTSQFSDPRTAFKRYSDTSLLVTEFVTWEPSSERAQAAIARTNYIHSGYRSSGAIREEDMLYTLSLFATEPIRFIDTYEWRKLTELEKCALGTFWKSVGDAMGVSYEPLPSFQNGGFRDGLHWLDEISAWSQAYEARAMVPDQKNRETADRTTAILTYMLPEPLKHVGLKFVPYMMDDRLRRAMLYDPPPPLYATIFSSLLQLRKFLLRYLALPRPYFLRSTVLTEKPDPQTGTFYVTKWDAAPFYVKPTVWNRWLSPTAWLTRLLGLPVPGDEGDKYYPRGYDIADVGPKAFAGRGKEYMDRQKEMLRKERTGGCPFHP